MRTVTALMILGRMAMSVWAAEADGTASAASQSSGGELCYSFFCKHPEETHSGRLIGLQWSDTAQVPEIRVEEVDGGRMEVVKGTPTYVRFYRDGVAAPVREYVMTPGSNVFSIVRMKEGRRFNETRFTHERLPTGEDSWEEEIYDGAGTRLSYEKRIVRETPTSKRTLKYKGDQVTERIDTFAIVDGQKIRRAGFRAEGTGSNRHWRLEHYFTEGPFKHLLRSVVDSDPQGKSMLFEHRFPDGGGDREVPLMSVVTIARNATEVVTNAEGVIVAFTGRALRQVNEYRPVDPRDDGRYEPDAARVSRDIELFPDGTSNIVKTVYHAYYFDATTGVQVAVSETAVPSTAPYGAKQNRRKASGKRGDGNGGNFYYEFGADGRLKVEHMSRCENSRHSCPGEDDIPWDLTVRERYETVQDFPSGIPFKTVVERVVFKQAGTTPLREERWIVLPEGGRELLSWTNHEYDSAGRKLSITTSEGERTEFEYDEFLTAERHSDGVERHWRTDAAERLVHSDDERMEANMRYDLGSMVTNVYGSIGARAYDYRLVWNDAGRLDDANGRPGEKVKVERDRDGAKRTLINGKLVMTTVTTPDETTVYQGPRGTSSPRWRKTAWDRARRLLVVTSPRLGGGLWVETNDLAAAEGGREVKSDTETSYVKRSGVWWREEREFLVEGTNRTARGGFRRRETGRRRDGADERVWVDANGHETRRLDFTDATRKTAMQMTFRPAVANPEITVSSNRFVIMTVSSSGVTNCFERGFQGQLLAQTDGRGKVTRYRYDDKGRQIGHTDRCGGAWTARYDEQGRLSCTTDPRGQLTRYQYDDLGRKVAVISGATVVRNEFNEFGDLVQVTKTVAGQQTESLENVYDEATGLLLERRLGNRTRVFGYSPSNTLCSVDGVALADCAYARTNGLDFVRDGFGRAVGYSVQGKRKLSVAFSPATGRLESFVVEGLGEVALEYLPGTDLIAAMAYPDGVTAAFEYDDEERPLRVIWRGLPEGERVIEARPKTGAAELELSLGDAMDGVPIAEDPKVYLLSGNALLCPVATWTADGRCRWHLLGTALETVGFIDGGPTK